MLMLFASGYRHCHIHNLERHTRFELVTSTLARLRSTNWASVAKWRRLPESNRGPRICNPLHSHSAKAPLFSMLQSLAPLRWLLLYGFRKYSQTKNCTFLSICFVLNQSDVNSTYTVQIYLLWLRQIKTDRQKKSGNQCRFCISIIAINR